MNILFGVPHRSILGLLLFNFFSFLSFSFLQYIPIAYYTEENTPDCIHLKIPNVLIKLENAAKTLLQNVKDNKMKANLDKCHLSRSNKKVSK